MSEYVDLSRLEKRCDQRKKAIAAQVCDRIGNAYGITDLCRWEAPVTKETVALSKVRKAAPDLYAALGTGGFINKSKPSRRFVALGSKEEESP